MGPISKITKVLSSSLLTSSLVFVPEMGASEEELITEETLLGKLLIPDLRSLLKTWNGIDLEVLRIYGVGPQIKRPGRILDEQKNNSQINGVIFGSDPSGFVYFFDELGEIYQLDTDGGNIELLTPNFNDFLSNYVFGKDSNKFMGNDWSNSLMALGLFE